MWTERPAGFSNRRWGISARWQLRGDNGWAPSGSEVWRAELAGGEAWDEALTRLQPVRGKDGVLRWRLWGGPGGRNMTGGLEVERYSLVSRRLIFFLSKIKLSLRDLMLPWFKTWWLPVFSWRRDNVSRARVDPAGGGPRAGRGAETRSQEERKEKGGNCRCRVYVPT